MSARPRRLSLGPSQVAEESDKKWWKWKRKSTSDPSTQSILQIALPLAPPGDAALFEAVLDAGPSGSSWRRTPRNQPDWKVLAHQLRWRNTDLLEEVSLLEHRLDTALTRLDEAEAAGSATPSLVSWFSAHVAPTTPTLRGSPLRGGSFVNSGKLRRSLTSSPTRSEEEPPPVERTAPTVEGLDVETQCRRYADANAELVITRSETLGEIQLTEERLSELEEQSLAVRKRSFARTAKLSIQAFRGSGGRARSGTEAPAVEAISIKSPDPAPGPQRSSFKEEFLVGHMSRKSELAVPSKGKASPVISPRVKQLAGESQLPRRLSVDSNLPRQGVRSPRLAASSASAKQSKGGRESAVQAESHQKAGSNVSLSQSSRMSPASSGRPRSGSDSPTIARSTQAKSAMSVLASFITEAASVAVSGVAGAVTPQRSGDLFEYFGVVGPDARSGSCLNGAYRADVDPTVLYHWPPTAEVDARLGDFCFPMGCAVERCSPGDSKVTNVLFGPLSELERLGPSFSFLLSGSDCLRYGVCVRRPEIVEMEPSFVAKASGSRIGGTLDPLRDECAACDRVYVLVSRFPFFELFFSVLHEIVGQERLLLQTGGAGVGEMAAEGRSMGLLMALHEAAVPMVDAPFVIEPAGVEGPRFKLAAGEEHEHIARWALPAACRLLSTDNWLLIIGALLLECRIVFLSKSPGKASACAFACLPLLRPWGFQGSFVPVLPRSLHEALAAPVPYVVGVASNKAAVYSVPEGVDEHLDESAVVVLVDQDKCRLPSGAPITANDVCERLPREDALRASLGAAFAALREENGGTSAVHALVRRATDELALYHHWLFASSKKALRTVMGEEYSSEDDTEVADRDDIDMFRDRFNRALDENRLEDLAPRAAEQCKPEHRSFVCRLILTQHFLDFVDAAVEQPKLRLVDSRLHELASLVSPTVPSTPATPIGSSSGTSSGAGSKIGRRRRTDAPAMGSPDEGEDSSLMKGASTREQTVSEGRQASRRSVNLSSDSSASTSDPMSLTRRLSTARRRRVGSSHHREDMQL